MGQNYEIYASKKAAALGFIISAICCAWAIYTLTMTEPAPVSSIKWSYVFDDTHQLMLTCLILMAPFLLFSLKNLSSSYPAITIDAEGIYDRRHFKYVIPWTYILRSGQDSMKFNGQTLRVLGLELTDYGRRDAKFTLMYHLNAWFYKNKNGNIICVQLNGLAYDSEDLERALRSHNHARPPSRSQAWSARLQAAEKKLFN